jgi:hypothetical protein
MARFEFVEQTTWFIEADTLDEAMSVWHDYRIDGKITDEMELIDGYGSSLGEVDES